MNLIPSPKPRSLRKSLVRAAALAVVNTAMLGVGFVAVSQMQPAAMVAPEHGDSAVMEGRAPAPHAPSTVLAKHADTCWTSSQQPKADLPGAAVVQFKDGTAVYTTKRVLVDAAFNEALASIGYGEHAASLPFESVIALCK